MQVVYEDADGEELTRHEVEKFAWHDHVPTHKIAQCEKHARVLAEQKKKKKENKRSRSLDSALDLAPALEEPTKRAAKVPVPRVVTAQSSAHAPFIIVDEVLSTKQSIHGINYVDIFD